MSEVNPKRDSSAQRSESILWLRTGMCEGLVGGASPSPGAFIWMSSFFLRAPLPPFLPIVGTGEPLSSHLAS